MEGVKTFKTHPAIRPTPPAPSFAKRETLYFLPFAKGEVPEGRRGCPGVVAKGLSGGCEDGMVSIDFPPFSWYVSYSPLPKEALWKKRSMTSGG